MSSVTHRIDTTYLNGPVEFYPPKISKEEYRENITNLANHLIDTNKGYQGKEADAKNPLKHILFQPCIFTVFCFVFLRSNWPK